MSLLAALLILCGGSAAASHLDCTSKGAREVAWDVTGYGRASPDTVPPPRPCSSACQTAIYCRKTLAACDGARSEQLQPHTLDLPTNSCSTAMCSQNSDRPTAHCSTTDASAAPHACLGGDTPLLPCFHRGTCRHRWPAMCPLQLADSETRPRDARHGAAPSHLRPLISVVAAKRCPSCPPSGSGPSSRAMAPHCT